MHPASSNDERGQHAGGANGPRLTGVIVTYKSWRTISAALASAKRCVDAGVMDLVVVDNNSPDQTREILAREAGFARVILHHENQGFGRGCNMGLAAVTTPYVVFFNPDAEMEPAACEAIVAFMDAHQRCAIAGPAIVHGGAGSDHAHEHLQRVGGLATPWDVIGDAMGLHSSYRKKREVRPGEAPFRTDWVSGAMLVGRTSVLRDLGGFDPRFFLYWEETDLCKRALAAGHEIWAIPGAVVRHIGGTSAAEESSDRVRGCIGKFYYESRHYYLRKHFGALAATMAEVGEYVLEPAYQGLRRLTGRKGTPVTRRWRYPVVRMPGEG